MDLYKGSGKRRIRSKIISIKPKTKTEADHSDDQQEKSLFDEFETILNTEVDNYKSLNYERISPHLILKFSRAFDQIIEHSEKYDSGSPSSKNESNSPKAESIFYYIKKAYENFIKRIIGINNMNEIEGVLKK